MAPVESQKISLAPARGGKFIQLANTSSDSHLACFMLIGFASLEVSARKVEALVTGCNETDSTIKVSRTKSDGEFMVRTPSGSRMNHFSQQTALKEGQHGKDDSGHRYLHAFNDERNSSF
jgi:hypothetical protein